ncbi:hypothetical protein ACFQ1I_01700 [Kitasatospora arboriphila]
MGTTAWRPDGFPAQVAEYGEALSEVARVYGTEDGAGPEEWAARLRFAALMRGDRALADWLDGLGLAMPWRVVWAHWRPIEVWDTGAVAPGWTGPVALHGFRAGGSEVCLQSRYDHSYRWYALEDGAPLGEPSPDEPAQEGPRPRWPRRWTPVTRATRWSRSPSPGPVRPPSTRSTRWPTTTTSRCCPGTGC